MRLGTFLLTEAGAALLAACGGAKAEQDHAGWDEEDAAGDYAEPTDPGSGDYAK